MEREIDTESVCYHLAIFVRHLMICKDTLKEVMFFIKHFESNNSYMRKRILRIIHNLVKNKCFEDESHCVYFFHILMNDDLSGEIDYELFWCKQAFESAFKPQCKHNEFYQYLINTMKQRYDFNIDKLVIH